MKEKEICNQCDPPHAIEFELSHSQREHLSTLAFNHNQLLFSKYRKGAAEHGGDLQDMAPLQLLDEAINECIDQFTYLYTLKQKLIRIIESKDLNG